MRDDHASRGISQGCFRAASGRRACAVHGTRNRLLIAETLIHQLDVLRFLLGPLSVVAARTLHTEPDMPGETLATILLEDSGGAPVVLAGSFVAPGFGTAVSDRLEIIGTHASVVLDENGLDLRGENSEHVAVDYETAYQACFDAAIGHFVDCLLSGAAFETSAEDNLETLKLVEDAYALAVR